MGIVRLGDPCADCEEPKLQAMTLFDDGSLAIDEVRCRHDAGRGDVEEHEGGHLVVFVRWGCFRRRTSAGTAVLDGTSAYCVNPGQEHRYDHPHHGGDACTAVRLKPDLVAAIVGGEPVLPDAALSTAPALDLAHRQLARRVLVGDEPHAIVEAGVALVAGLLSQAAPDAVATGRPVTARSRLAAVDAAREALAEDHSRSLEELARLVAVSPHHLSRILVEHTGTTVSRYRMRLRTRYALERLTDGEHDLARVAADAGFADHSHLCRAVRAHLGTTPSALRAALSNWQPGSG